MKCGLDEAVKKFVGEEESSNQGPTCYEVVQALRSRVAFLRDSLKSIRDTYTEAADKTLLAAHLREEAMRGLASDDAAAKETGT